MRHKSKWTHNKADTLTIIQIILYEILTTRNNYKYDKIQISQDTIKTKINAQIQNIIQTH